MGVVPPPSIKALDFQVMQIFDIFGHSLHALVQIATCIGSKLMWALGSMSSPHLPAIYINDIASRLGFSQRAFMVLQYAEPIGN